MNERLKECLLLLTADSDEDENESEDEADDSEYLLLCLTTNCMSKETKIIKTYAEKRFAKFTDQQFVHHLCIKKELIHSLSKQFKKSTYYTKIADHGKASLSAENHLFVFLWFVGHKNATYRQVAKYFRVSLSTVYLTLQRVSAFLNDISSEVIEWPNVLERQESAKTFFKIIGLNGIVGCVCNIYIKTEQSRKDCNSKKESNLIPVQLVLNDKNKIIHLYIGNKNNNDTDSLFLNSNLQEKLSSLEADEHLIGDNCYPCLENLLTPFEDDSKLDVSYCIYNQKIYKCLNECQKCLSIMIEKFSQLDQLKVRNSKLQYLVIKACFVLYNLDYNEDECTKTNTFVFNADTISKPDMLEKGHVKRMSIVNKLFQ